MGRGGARVCRDLPGRRVRQAAAGSQDRCGQTDAGGGKQKDGIIFKHRLGSSYSIIS